MTRLTLAALTFVLLGCSTITRNQEPAWIPATVVMIEEEYANIDLNLTGTQLADHGIVHGSTFNVKYKDHQMTAFLGKDYADVEKGRWIALIEQEGNLQLAISFGHAATAIACKPGDTIMIQSISGN